MDNTPTPNGNLAIVLHYLFKILPVLVGGGAIYLGYDLFIKGVTGQASLSVKSKEVSGQLLNATPGLFFAVGGIVTIIIAVWKGVEISFGSGGPPPPKGNAKAQGTGGGGGGGFWGRFMTVSEKKKEFG